MKKKKLKLVGFFKELELSYNSGESIVSSKNKSLEEDKILSYLKSGTELLTSMGIAEDYFNEDELIGPPNIITDGEYAWPETLTYYIKKYHVLIKQEFVEHIKNNDWKVPSLNKIKLNKLEL